ncbi:MAG: tetratricopeptide repeat protein [Bacteroidetes bacterium]|nr:tetratricopeptide repeat protein [Bacteroidota bacterium]
MLLLILAVQLSCNPNRNEEKKNTSVQKTDVAASEYEKLNQRLAANPNDADALYQRAKIYVGEKKFKLAATDINQAVLLDSTKADYFMIQADVLFANLQVPFAIQAFQKCIALDPNNIDAYLKMAELHLYIKKYKESIQYANEALKIDKHKAKAYFIKGFVYKESGDTVKAISSFQTCVEQEPENYDAYMQLGILFQSKRNKLAVQYYNNALHLDPKSTEALYDRGMYYQENREFNNAIEDYTSILRIDPNHKDAHYNLGYIHLVYLKVYDQAIKHFSDAIRCDPNFVQAYYNRGLSYESVGDVAAAAADYKQALSLFPTYKLAKDGLKRVKG